MTLQWYCPSQTQDCRLFKTVWPALLFFMKMSGTVVHARSETGQIIDNLIFLMPDWLTFHICAFIMVSKEILVLVYLNLYWIITLMLLMVFSLAFICMIVCHLSSHYLQRIFWWVLPLKLLPLRHLSLYVVLTNPL